MLCGFEDLAKIPQQKKKKQDEQFRFIILPLQIIVNV